MKLKGQEKWDYIIQKRNENNLSEDQIAQNLGYKDKNGMHVWITRNRSKFEKTKWHELMDKIPKPNDKRKDRKGANDEFRTRDVDMLNEPKKKKKAKAKRLPKVTQEPLSYDAFLNFLKEHSDLPYADIVLNRIDGKIKRDRSLVQAVIHLINAMNK